MNFLASRWGYGLSDDPTSLFLRPTIDGMLMYSSLLHSSRLLKPGKTSVRIAKLVSEHRSSSGHDARALSDKLMKLLGGGLDDHPGIHELAESLLSLADFYHASEGTLPLDITWKPNSPFQRLLREAIASRLEVLYRATDGKRIEWSADTMIRMVEEGKTARQISQSMSDSFTRQYGQSGPYHTECQRCCHWVFAKAKQLSADLALQAHETRQLVVNPAPEEERGLWRYYEQLGEEGPDVSDSDLSEFDEERYDDERFEDDDYNDEEFGHEGFGVEETVDERAGAESDVDQGADAEAASNTVQGDTYDIFRDKDMNWGNDYFPEPVPVPIEAPENKRGFVREYEAEGPFRFLDLPRELRDMIYRHALVVTQQRCAVDGTARPTLLRVNRQIRDEGLPIFYGENTFLVTIKRHVGETTNKPALARFQDEMYALEVSEDGMHIENLWVKLECAFRMDLEHLAEFGFGFHLGFQDADATVRGPLPGRQPRESPWKANLVAEGRDFLVDWWYWRHVQDEIMPKLRRHNNEGIGCYYMTCPDSVFRDVLAHAGRACPFAGEHVDLIAGDLGDFRDPALEGCWDGGVFYEHPEDYGFDEFEHYRCPRCRRTAFDFEEFRR